MWDVLVPRIHALWALAILGCGGAGVGAPEPSPNGADDEASETAAAEEEVDLGCTRITGTDIDAELAIHHRLGGELSRAEARSVLVRRAAVSRWCDDEGYAVDPERVTEAIESQARAHGMTPAELGDQLRAAGVPKDVYRHRIEAGLRELWITGRLPLDDATVAELDAEARRRMAQDPGATLDEVRLTVYFEVQTARFEVALAEYVEALRAIETHRDNGGCTEVSAD
jgi:hypothetical protein